MVDITITPANVIAGSNAQKLQGIAGATITAGQVVYRDPATGKFLLADANGTADARTPIGIALHGASLDQPLMVITEGDLALGAAMVNATAYFLSDTPGGICPAADVGAGEFVTVLGVSSSTSNLKVKMVISGASN